MLAGHSGLKAEFDCSQGLFCFKDIRLLCAAGVIVSVMCSGDKKKNDSKRTKNSAKNI